MPERSINIVGIVMAISWITVFIVAVAGACWAVLGLLALIAAHV